MNTKKKTHYRCPTQIALHNPLVLHPSTKNPVHPTSSPTPPSINPAQFSSRVSSIPTSSRDFREGVVFDYYSSGFIGLKDSFRLLTQWSGDSSSVLQTKTHTQSIYICICIYIYICVYVCKCFIIYRRITRDLRRVFRAYVSMWRPEMGSRIRSQEKRLGGTENLI